VEQYLIIPGLGDGLSARKLFRRWSSRTRQVTVFETNWATDEPYHAKYKRLLEAYNKIKSRGPVTLVAISAGGALANRILSENPEVSRAHIICGAITDKYDESRNFLTRAPAIVDSIAASEKALKNVGRYQDKVTTYRPIYDRVVRLDNMLVGGCDKRRIPAIGHGFSILVALLFYLPQKRS